MENLVDGKHAVKENPTTVAQKTSSAAMGQRRKIFDDDMPYSDGGKSWSRR